MLLDREDIAVLCDIPASVFYGGDDTAHMLSVIVTGGFEGEVMPHTDGQGVMHEGCPAHLTEMHAYLTSGRELLLSEPQMQACERTAIQTLRENGIVPDADADFLSSQRI